jgi:hypothetical protein
MWKLLAPGVGLGDFLTPAYVEISANHIGLGSVILPFPYAEIGDNHTGLGSVILPCLYAVIRDNHMGLA